MKKKFAITGVFLLTYVFFLIVTLPATLLMSQLPLPKNISISGVTGSVWQTEIAQLTIGKNVVEKVSTKLSFWSLFTLTPRLAINFGDSFSAGPEGELILALSQESAEITDLTLLIKANDVAQQLALPLPITAKGDVELNIASVEIDLKKNNQCISAKGMAAWSKAGVVALEQNIKLGNFNADISCENGALALVISDKNDLGLTFNAYVRQGGRFSGNGYLKPGVKFPQTLNNVLPFLGKKDNQGRYRLSF